jgi:hypothetical protein
MTRPLAMIVFALCCVAPLGADVTITTTTTLEGGPAAMAGGVSPTVVTRIKGDKSRTDVEMGQHAIATLVDLTANQAILLRPDQKTAQVLDTTSAMAAAPQGDVVMPKIETSVKPTGQSREIAGTTCQEFAVTMRMDMAPMAKGRADMSPEAAATLGGMRMTMTGSVWVARDAPGSAEYLTFQTGAAKLARTALSRAGRQGLPGGMDQLLTGFAEAPGIPYLTELTMGFEGNEKLAAVMKQVGAMKIVSRVTAVSTEPLADALFSIPADYKVLKQ